MMLEIVDPSNGEPIDRVPTTGASEIQEKVAAARAAQPTWAALALEERLGTMRAFRGMLVSAREDLARTLTREVGKPIAQSRRELEGVLARLDFFLAESPKALADEEVWREGGMREVVAREALGVVANVSAWNYPYFVGSNVFVPALLAGNAVLYKPSELATLTGLKIADMMREAGVPKEIFAPVVGGGDAGAALVAQPLDGVFFTGSYATGKRIVAAVRDRLAHLQLELGGKDPAYVTDDVDVATAAASLADGAFYNAGQSCCSVERVYVHERVADAFEDAFLAEVKSFVVGDPSDERTYVGPVARRANLDVLERQVADARAKGATIRVGGHRIAQKGNWFEPTVVTGATSGTALMREESFGPLIGIQRVRDDEEALDLMADTEYGLTAGVYARDETRARALLRRLDVGSAYWNCCDRVSPRLPWSGRRHSGVGVTLGRDGILAFTRPKAYHLREG